MRYQIIIINTNTGEKKRTLCIFSNRAKAEEFASKWKSLGNPYDCEIIDTKKERKERAAL